MRVALTCTWRPHGELPRLLRALPRLRELYSHLIVALIDAEDSVYRALADQPGLLLVRPPDGAHSRMAALNIAGNTEADFVHYCDMDRLLRWNETYPDELRAAIEAITRTDCLVLGRTAAAFATHPQAMQTTESLINEVASHLLEQTVDICAGAKGLSRPLLQFLLTHAPVEGWGDVSWAVLARRGGFSVTSFAAQGLDYETADRHQSSAAGAGAQRCLAASIDGDPLAWSLRVRVAREILAEGLLAQIRSLDMP